MYPLFYHCMCKNTEHIIAGATNSKGIPGYSANNPHNGHSDFYIIKGVLSNCHKQ